MSQPRRRFEWAEVAASPPPPPAPRRRSPPAGNGPRPTPKMPLDPEVRDLLVKLFWHHNSQRKGAPRCSDAYHGQLTAALSKIVGIQI